MVFTTSAPCQSRLTGIGLSFLDEGWYSYQLRQVGVLGWFDIVCMALSHAHDTGLGTARLYMGFCYQLWF